MVGFRNDILKMFARSWAGVPLLDCAGWGAGERPNVLLDRGFRPTFGNHGLKVTGWGPSRQGGNATPRRARWLHQQRVRHHQTHTAALSAMQARQAMHVRAPRPGFM